MPMIITVWAKLSESYRAKRLEWFFAALLMFLGVWLLLPFETFASSPTYLMMARWADETTWGLAFFAAGWVRLVIIVINGAWWRTAFFRAVAAFYSLFFWLSLFVGILAANPESLGMMYGLVFAAEVSNMRLAGKEAGTAEKIAIAKARLPETGWRGFICYVIGLKRRDDGSSRH